MKKLNEFVREEWGVRSSCDHRKRVNRLIVSYLDENGLEYRRSYEFDKTMGFEEMAKHVDKTIW